MSVTNFTGPLIVNGQSATSGTENPDLAPSPIWGGLALLDWRYGYKQDSNTTRACGFYMGGGMVLVDQVPSQVATNNIAGLQGSTSGTAIHLANGLSGAGVTIVSGAAFTVVQTGNVVPLNTLVIDKLPATISFGQNSSVQVPDPSTTIARAVAITASSGAAGGDMKVAGYDLYGQPQTEKITVGAGANTVNGKKGWKFVSSVTPSFTDATTYSVGTADIYEFPLRVNTWAYATVTWANQQLYSGTATTVFTAAQTSANLFSGSVRGTVATPSASDGTKAIQLFAELAPSMCGTVSGVFGVTPA